MRLLSEPHSHFDLRYRLYAHSQLYFLLCMPCLCQVRPPIDQPPARLWHRSPGGADHAFYNRALTLLLLMPRDGSRGPLSCKLAGASPAPAPAGMCALSI